MSEDKSLTKIPNFDGQHYDHWSELMENLLRAKGLWSLVENGIHEPIMGTALSNAQQTQLDDAKMKDHQVKHYLYQAIDRVTFEQILDRRTSNIRFSDKVQHNLLPTLVMMVTTSNLWWPHLRSFDVLFGNCPYCSEPVAVKLNDKRKHSF